VVLRPFRPDDAPAWLELNRAAFRELPDQAGLTGADLEARLAASWHDPEGFLVAQDGTGRLLGFHWTKVDPDEIVGGRPAAEVYAIGVAPSARGGGLARALLDAGLAHLAARGSGDVHLYVEAANEPAIRLYRSAGFEHVDTDRQYSWG
jgi:mycothiol synthase